MTHEFAIVGGGLQGALLALALGDRSLVLVEGGASLGGNHLWSFHGSDLPDRGRALVEPLVVARWPGYEVAFPDFTRRIDGEYACISSERLDQVVREVLGKRLLFGAQAVRVSETEVELSDGRLLRARQVLDCRGPSSLTLVGAHAWQKFCGVEVLTSRAPELPMLMDARVSQEDGFRFIYTLPLARDRVLVEDTRFSEDSRLDVAQVQAQALQEARAAGHLGEIIRSEHGVLPLPIDRMPKLDPRRIGYGGGFFHPVTGYSLPIAVRVSLRIARGEALGGPWLAALRRQQRFALLLNRLLYRATAEPDRWRVLSRFHTLPQATLQRFYALETTRIDRARMLCGIPPRGVSLRRAIEALGRGPSAETPDG